MCNCIEKVEKKLEKQHGCKVEIDTAFIFQGNGQTKETFKVNYYFHEKKKDESLAKRESKGILTFGYCPICGKKIT
jgi:hypothetical protein